MNGPKSAFFSVSFAKESFDSFVWSGTAASQSAAFSCCLRIPAKSLNCLFRLSLQAEGAGEGFAPACCSISFVPSAAKFCISFAYAFGLTKSTNVYYAEQLVSYPVHPPVEAFPHHFACAPKSLVGWFGCFQGGAAGGKCEELLFDFSTSGSVTLSGKAIGAAAALEADASETAVACTKLVLRQEQFHSVLLSPSASSISWSTGFGEFKALASLAAALDEGCALSVFFDDVLQSPVVCRGCGGALVAVFAKNNAQEAAFPSGEAAIVSVVPTVSEPVGLSESEGEEFVPSTPPRGKKWKVHEGE